jgi:hypothetical protein
LRLIARGISTHITKASSWHFQVLENSVPAERSRDIPRPGLLREARKLLSSSRRTISSACTSGRRASSPLVLTTDGTVLLRSEGRGIRSRRGAATARDRDIRVSLTGGTRVSSSRTRLAVRVDPGTSIQDISIRAIPGSGLGEGIRDTGPALGTQDIAPQEVLPVSDPELDTPGSAPQEVPPVSGPELGTPVSAPQEVPPVVGRELDTPVSVPQEVLPVVGRELDTPVSAPQEVLLVIDRQQAFPGSGQHQVFLGSDRPRGEVPRGPAGISAAAKGRR